MTWLAKIRCAFQALVRRSRAERELSDELQAHLDMQVAANIAAGMDAEEARYTALRSFGGIDLAKEQCRDVRRVAILDSLGRDFRFAMRMMRKNPGFTAVVVLTLGLGIGATTSVFSLVNAALLKPPPYPDPQRIVVLGDRSWSQSGEIFSYIRERVRSFDRVAAYSGSSGWNFVFGNRAEYVAGLPISEGFFETLGVVPALGRTFNTLEDQPNGPPAIVLSDALWRRMLEGRPDAIGEIVLLGGEAHTIVGIMPSGFQTIPAADVWTPLRLSSTDRSFNYTVLGRLRSDRSPAQAAAELASVSSEMRRDLQELGEARSRALQWVPYQKWLGLAGRNELLLLLGAVLVLLLVACANVACLQLVRAESRRREMATRSTLGGGKGRLIQQVLTESVLLAMLGAALGISLAHWGTQALLPLVPGWVLEGRTVELDWRVLAVTVVVAVGAGILFGLAPALTSSRLDLRTALLVEGARNTAGRPIFWLRRFFAVTQVALAVLLLAGAGLLVRTFVNLRAVELGFDPSNVVIGKMSLQGSTSQTKEQFSVFLGRALGRLREISGVTAAAVGSNIPVEGGLNLPLEPPVGGLLNHTRAVDWRYVTPEYFSLFGIPVRAGRLFEEGDRPESAPVVLINEAFARVYFGGTRDTLGRFLQLGGDLGDPARQIVGVVGDVKAWSRSGWTGGINALGSATPPTMYVPAAQVPESILQLTHHFVPMSWAVRTSRSDVIPAVQQVVQSAEPRLPFISFTTMEQVIARDLEKQRFMMLLLGLFASLSLVLASIGVYGLFAYTASQRTKEIGIRIALGATPTHVLRDFLADGMILIVSGAVIGIVAAVFASRLLASLIFGIQPLDPLTFASVSALLLLVMGVATVIPAHRAARVDPMIALRSD